MEKVSLIDKIKELYYGRKLSAKEIGKILKKSEWQIYRLMKKNNLPRRKPEETTKIIFERKPSSFKIKNLLSLEEEKLKWVGVALYWAEGYKRKKRYGATVEFSNSDPKMIQIFLRFLREICGINESRLRARIYCYSNQNEGELKKFWEKITKIPPSQFNRSYIRNDFSPSKINRMKHGLLRITYSDTKLFYKIKEWIEELKNFNI